MASKNDPTDNATESICRPSAIPPERKTDDEHAWDLHCERHRKQESAAVAKAIAAERERIAERAEAQPWQGALGWAEAIRNDKWDV